MNMLRLWVSLKKIMNCDSKSKKGDVLDELEKKKGMP